MDLSFHAASTLFLTLVALYLFTQDRLRLETSALLILVALGLLFTLYPYTRSDGSQITTSDFYAGFGHDALIAICALMILGQGMQTTGAIRPISRTLAIYWNNNPRLMFFIALLSGAILSGFLNNTPIVIMLIPILISVSMTNQSAPSKVLMPMGFATLIGGMSTTIGTSTNLLIVAIAADISQVEFGLFDFSMTVILVGIVGLLFLWFASPLLLPERNIDLTNTSQRIYHAVLFLSDTSYTAGKDIREVLEKTHHRVSIHKIRRRKNQIILPLPTVLLQPKDALFISGTAEDLKDFEYQLKGKLHNIDKVQKLLEGDYSNQEGEQVMAEVLITPDSMLDNNSLDRARLAEKYNIVVLALHRLNHPTQRINDKLSKILLHQGDILLVQGRREDIQLIKDDSHLLVLDNKINYISTDRAPIAITIMLAVIGVAAMNLMPISISALSGACIMLLTRCLTWRDISKSLNVQVIMIIVVSLALGRALIDTGGSDYLAYQFVELTQGMHTILILGSLLLLMSIITNVVSNTVAAVVGTPVAVTIAQQLGAPVEPFILAVLFGANMSYATPIGYQTNLLIYSAGGYRFADFLRLGIPLTLIMAIGFTIALAIKYSL